MSVAPLQFLLLVFAGWVNRHQAEVVAYLQEENRVLREPRSPFGRRAQVVGKVVGSRSYDRLSIEREKGFEPGST
jgi:hypothetical protein